MFLLASDLHLAPLIWTDRPQIKHDAYRALQSIADYAIRTREPLILAGDLFDVRRPPPDAVVVMNAFMTQMQQAGVTVFYTQGQHELSRDATWVGTHSHPHHVHKKVFYIEGRTFYGLDWLPRGELQEELAKIPPEVEFLVCHQVWQDFMGTNCATDGAIAEIPANVKFVLTGDFHKHMILPTLDRKVVSPGSTYIRSISEETEKHFFHAKAAGNGQVIFHDVPIRGRTVLRVEIKTQDELDRYCKYLRELPEEIDDLRRLTHIKISQDLPEWHGRLTAAAEGRSHLYLDPQPVINTDVEVSANMVIATDVTPTAAMSACATSVVRESPSVLAKVQGVLSHPDKAAALEYWKGLYTRHMAVPACGETNT